VQGPQLTLPMEVQPPAGRVAFSVVAPALALALIGIPTAADLGGPLRITLTTIGVLLGGLLGAYGYRTPSVSNVYGSPSPPHTGTAATATTDRTHPKAVG